MKLENINILILNGDESMPSKIENGILYISEHWKVAIHNCACGCGIKTVTPLGENEWTLIKNGDEISLNPSIGNWAGENPYHAHYYIKANKIEWC